MYAGNLDPEEISHNRSRDDYTYFEMDYSWSIVNLCQFGMDVRRTVGAFRFLMDFTDLLAQLLIRLHSCRRCNICGRGSVNPCT
jgi:hypothetical protein